VKRISVEAERVLREFDWPGNVRELEHAIESAVVLGSSEELLVSDLPKEVVLRSGKALAEQGMTKIVHQAERYAFESALLRTGGRFRNRPACSGFMSGAFFGEWYG
jgi:DNA-binding NtrC family response regulator